MIEGRRLRSSTTDRPRNTQRPDPMRRRGRRGARAISSPPVGPATARLRHPRRTDRTRASVAEIAQAIEADSLGFVSLDGLRAAVGLDAEQLCSACFDGHYPIRIPSSAAATLGIKQETA